MGNKASSSKEKVDTSGRGLLLIMTKLAFNEKITFFKIRCFVLFCLSER